MLMPKRSKFRKQHRGRMEGEAHRGATLVFGEWGLQALEPVWLTSKQIEAARRAITHNTRRGGQVWIRVFPDKSVTAKPAETRMGSGKGGPDHWVAVVRPGHIIFEVGGIREDLARQALTMAGHKLPIHTRILGRDAEAGGPEQKEAAMAEAAPAVVGGDAS